MNRVLCEEGGEVLHVIEMNTGREKLRSYRILSKDCTECSLLLGEGHS